jgi:hypothetical protein
MAAKKTTKRTTRRTSSTSREGPLLRALAAEAGVEPAQAFADVIVEVLTGVPNTRVPVIEAALRQNTRYITHTVQPDGPGTSTIIAHFRRA